MRDPPAAYGHAVAARDGGAWLQYWLFYAYQDQDRGIVRTGRHAGDWELVQYRVDAAAARSRPSTPSTRAPSAAAAATVELRGGRPVVYAAHGSHASYFHAGTRDRTWPDPNDEADGRGAVVRPRLVAITRELPVLDDLRRRRGAARGRALVRPAASRTPRAGPPSSRRAGTPRPFAASAHGCRAACDQVGECDGREKALTGAAFALPLALLRPGVRHARHATATRTVTAVTRPPRTAARLLDHADLEAKQGRARVKRS